MNSNIMIKEKDVLMQKSNYEKFSDKLSQPT